MASSSVIRSTMFRLCHARVTNHLANHNAAVVASAIYPVHQLYFARGAGHSKAQNRAPQKLINIARKTGASHKLIGRARSIYIETKEADPKKNPKLERLMAEANKHCVGKTLGEFLKKLQKNGPLQRTEVVLRGPNGSCIILTASVDQPMAFKDQVSKIYKKTIPSFVPSPAGPSGSLEQRGAIVVEAAEGMDLDRAEELAIECEAEEVDVETQDDVEVFKFLTAAEDLYKVKSALEEQGVAIDSYQHTYVPVFTATVEQKLEEAVDRFLERAENELEELEEIFMNIERSS